MSSQSQDQNAKKELRAAFDEMIASLVAAREAIDDPALHPPPATSRNLAEGYRYLMGYVCGASERAFAEDTDFPYFKRAVPPHNKSTWDNADNLYLSAPIHPEQEYRIRGRARDTRHWRGEPAVAPSAPWYVIFSAITHYTGDSGGLAELMPSVTNNAGSLDSGELQVDADGRFEIRLGPDRPAGYEGNFISTRAQLPSGETQGARYLICRQLFADWEHEETLELEIVNLDRIGAPRPAPDPESTVRKLRRAGEIVNHQMRFWNEFFDTILDGYGSSPAPTPFAFPPRNQLNAPSPPSATVGAGQATNIYAGGLYSLRPDEALILEQQIPVPPVYTGFSLCNIWGESYDYANYVCTLNNHQARADSDGRVRYVIAHDDPGINNWLDTTGHPEGMMSLRWAYHAVPDLLPSVELRVVPLADVLSELPADTLRVSPEERREQVRIRQEHSQRRYRQS